MATATVERGTKVSRAEAARRVVAAWGLGHLLVPRPRLPLEQWVVAHRRVTSGPIVGAAGVAVPWSHEYDPLGVVPLAAVLDRRWSAVVYMASPQSAGKTELAISLAAYGLAELGVNVLYYGPTRELSQDQFKKKFLPALAACDATASLIPADREVGGVAERRDFTNGTSLFVRGAESRAALAGVTAPITIGDDLQAMRLLPEGDHPADLARERADAYPPYDRHHLLLGQPGLADDYLARTLRDSTCYCPLLPCPKCGGFQLVAWERIEYDVDELRRGQGKAFLRCADGQCGHRWRPEELRAAIHAGIWVSPPASENWVDPPEEVAEDAEDEQGAQSTADTAVAHVPANTAGTAVPQLAVPQLAVPQLAVPQLAVPQAAMRTYRRGELAEYPETNRRTTVCGFWRSALYWPFVPWATQAQRYLEALGDPEKMINFGKRILARPWRAPEPDKQALSEDEIAGHVGTEQTGYAAGSIPDGCDRITLTVDVQAGYCYWILRGWNAADGTSWLINVGTTRKHSHVQAGEMLAADERKERHAAGIQAALDELFGMMAGVPYHVALIDSKYHPDVVYRACVRYGFRRHRPIQGAKARRGARPIWPPKPAQTAGRYYYPVGVNEAKHVLRALLRIRAGQPGYWHMPRDLAARTLKAYARHMSSERWNPTRGLWERRDEGSGPNHWWDCETYQIAAAVACGVRLAAFDQAGARPAESESGQYKARQSGGTWRVGR